MHDNNTVVAAPLLYIEVDIEMAMSLLPWKLLIVWNDYRQICMFKLSYYVGNIYTFYENTYV